ncbi:hypothetical protein [Pseudomonas sp. 2FG]|uniref:hypothetical protein n=1 Tax=Pseudomonas sp. 2FG TaxID=2502191 RepID=UPI0010F45008|nr:hypothetical protein [Pseudomonas sp. 2FG]
MKRLLVLLTILAIAGCAATSTVHKKYGKKGLHINCSGLTSSWEKCDEEAVMACGLAGYKVMAKSGVGEGDYAENYPLGLNPDGFSSRNMIVICR